MNPRRILTWAAPLLAFAWPARAFALELPEWTLGLCQVLPCRGIQFPGAAGLADYVGDKLIPALLVGFVAVLGLFLFLAAFNMVSQAADENVVTEARTLFYHAIIASCIVGLALWFTLAFDPTKVVVVDIDPIEQGIFNIIVMLNLLLAIGLIVNIVIQAFRLINAHGEQEQMEKARKRIVTSLIGVALVLLANSIVNASKPGAQSSIAAGEIVGIANFMLALIGVLAVLAIIIAGILLVFSINEDLKEKAKTSVRVSVIALLVVLMSYAGLQLVVSLA